MADQGNSERSTWGGVLRLLLAVLALILSGLLVAGGTSVPAATGLAPRPPEVIADPALAAGVLPVRSEVLSVPARDAVATASAKAETASAREPAFNAAAEPAGLTPSRHAATLPEVVDLMALVLALMGTLALIAWRRRA